MIVVFPVGPLPAAVSHVAHTLPPKPLVPVLAGIFIDATRDGATLRTFDHHASSWATVPDADVAEPGSVLVSGRTLAEMVRRFPNQPVQMSADEHGAHVQIRCGTMRARLLGMPVEEYPAPPPQPDPVGTVEADDLARIVASAAAAASDNDATPSICNVRITVDGQGRLCFTSTDRYRMFRGSVPWKRVKGFEGELCVPASRLHQLVKGMVGEVAIGVSDASVGLDTGRAAVTIPRHDAEYPKVDALFPGSETVKTWAVVDREALIDAVLRVGVLAEKGRPCRVAFSDGQVTLSTQESQDNTGMDSLPCEIEGPDMVGNFNPQFLLTCLGSFRESRVCFGFTKALAPVLIEGASGDDGDPVQCLLMPVRLVE